MSAAKAHEVLEKLDQKTFGFFHIKMIVVSQVLRLEANPLSRCKLLTVKQLHHCADLRNGILHRCLRSFQYFLADKHNRQNILPRQPILHNEYGEPWKITHQLQRRDFGSSFMRSLIRPGPVRSPCRSTWQTIRLWPIASYYDFHGLYPIDDIRLYTPSCCRDTVLLEIFAWRRHRRRLPSFSDNHV